MRWGGRRQHRRLAAKRRDAACIGGLSVSRTPVSRFHGPENLALLRKIALNLARADGSLKASLKGKRKYAAWDDAFMVRVHA